MNESKTDSRFEQAEIEVFYYASEDILLTSIDGVVDEGGGIILPPDEF